MNKCEHEFKEYVGIRVFNETGLAWVQLAFTEGPVEDLPRVQMCIHCGEQGYEVPA